MVAFDEEIATVLSPDHRRVTDGCGRGGEEEEWRRDGVEGDATSAITWTRSFRLWLLCQLVESCPEAFGRWNPTASANTRGKCYSLTRTPPAITRNHFAGETYTLISIQVTGVSKPDKPSDVDDLNDPSSFGALQGNRTNARNLAEYGQTLCESTKSLQKRTF